MAYGFGTGFLNTDPRTQKGPKGGSIHASQDKDSSVINTGDMSDGSMGFASKSAFSGGGMFDKAKPHAAQDPEYQPRTAAETRQIRTDRGVAASHENMGSLAVAHRATEKAKTDAGQETNAERDAGSILKARADKEYQRTILEPAEREGAKFRAKAESAGKYMKSFMANPTDSVNNKQFNRDAQSGTRGGILLGGGKKSGGGAGGGKRGLGLDAYKKTGRGLAPDHAGTSNQVSKDFQKVKDDPDIMALDAQRAHGAAPGTQEVDWVSTANAQSASGKATVGELAQASVSMYTQRRPNRTKP